MSNVVNLKNNNEVPPWEQKPVVQEQALYSLPDEISWDALEYRHIKKSPDWYWAVGILTIGLFAVSLIFSNILFGVFVLVSGFTVALYGARPPRTVSFKLATSGVHIAHRVYPYQSLRSFWIFYHPPDIKEISIESQKTIMPHIVIPLGDTNPTQVRAYLLQFLTERPQEESLIDSLARYAGF